MISVADIPFKIFHFKGIICILMVDGCEYRFATYNGAKLVECNVNDGILKIVLKRGSYCLVVKTKYDTGFKLLAPIKGKMEKDIFESISSIVEVTLSNKENIIFSGINRNCGLEIVFK